MSTNTIPIVPFGTSHISRLILGANPINGGSHLSRFVNNQMKRYFTNRSNYEYARTIVNHWASIHGNQVQEIWHNIKHICNLVVKCTILHLPSNLIHARYVGKTGCSGHNWRRAPRRGYGCVLENKTDG